MQINAMIHFVNRKGKSGLQNPDQRSPALMCTQIFIWKMKPCESMFLFLSLFIYAERERERERERMSRGGADREGDRESRAGSVLSAHRARRST